MVAARNSNGVPQARTAMQPVIGVVALTTSTTTMPVQTVRAFVDNPGQSAAGGVVLDKRDASIFGGLVPSNMKFEIFGLEVYPYITDGSSAVTEIAIQQLAACVQVSLQYSGQEYNLGFLGEYLGPSGQPVAASGRSYPQRFGNPWQGPTPGFFLEAGQQISLDFNVVRAAAAGFASGKVYGLRFRMPANYRAQGSAAAKQ